MTTDQAAVYVYGIVPADVEPEPHATGVGDPPGEVAVVRHGEIAALISTLESDRPLGTPDDLTAHAELLDGSAAVAPVLPLRFGAVMTDTEAVENELLGANEDEFRAALEQLEGRAQFVIRGRYVEDTILRELLEENDEAARLRDEIRDKPEDATRNARIALGELINQAIEAKRAEDTHRVVSELEQFDALVNHRDPSHEEEAVHIAVLVELARQKDLEETLRRLGEDWEGRVELSLLGPMAAYDFVTKHTAEG
ncbi:GvpL/GvpF family gas vesicle protein [Streptomyces gardneri]|uniref:GvpL/GvpF family gas vesicle protein n=1 Tax=Nocardia TaxID=1817 RepID=UPI0013591AA3|nr:MULTISPECIES: GvpL/GvpF family gas vesicle protein [Nocardia]MBF6163515.1 GvpL/GvpF family gas vesicle protein [Streptomyces gardneri]MBF6202513.1 GvpL/GvpF family gas vesicle protein [Streptomyces gardneri]UAK35077.1 GvpL/GvpF family gas vesicle protein [Nocardia asteroides]